MKRVYFILAIIFSSGLIACDRDSEDVPSYCQHLMYFESSAVCSSSIDDAALRDGEGRVYIALDFFKRIDRSSVTIDQAFHVAFRSVAAPSERIECGTLIEAPFIKLNCVELAE